MIVEEINPDNISILTALILELWPECNYEKEFQNCKQILTKQTETVYLAKMDSQYIGFIYLSLRSDYVEGTNSNPVAYIEGLYIKPKYRQKGIGKKLVERGEKWGLENNCTEIGSDTEVQNHGSIAFHKGIGFEEANRVVCFRKDLAG